MWEYIVTAVVVLLVLVFAYFVYSGLLHNIRIKTCKSQFGGCRIAYKFLTGPYKNCGPWFKKICKFAPQKTCMGIYYDDTDTVAADKLRCAVCCVLSWDGEPVDDALTQKMQKSGFKLFQFPAPDSVVTTKFPFVSTLSMFIAMFRVYPKLAKYIEQEQLKAYPCMEIYKDNWIHYVSPLDHQDQFYVPEAC